MLNLNSVPLTEDVYLHYPTADEISVRLNPDREAEGDLTQAELDSISPVQ